MATDARVLSYRIGNVALGDMPIGYCQCGCGEATEIARKTRSAQGIVKGQPLRFIKGHRNRKRIQYVEEDRGYDTPCWIWQLHLTPAGYGQKFANGRKEMAHRLYYEGFVGAIPDGLDLDHLCRQPACVNPAHLEPVTKAENQHRGIHGRLVTAYMAFAARLVACSTDLSPRQVAELLGVSRTTAWDILHAPQTRHPAA